MDAIIICDACVNDVKAIRQVAFKTWTDTFPNAECGITKEDIIVGFTYNSEKAKSEYISKKQKIISEDKTQHYWIAKDNGKVIGFCLAKKGEPRNILQAIHVTPDYQGRKVGRRLMKTALNWLGNKKDIQISVAVYNQNAISFYEIFGFRKTCNTLTSIKLPSGKEIPHIEMVKLAELLPIIPQTKCIKQPVCK